jgi:hypothetical protein
MLAPTDPRQQDTPRLLRLLDGIVTIRRHHRVTIASPDATDGWIRMDPDGADIAVAARISRG